MRSRHADGSGWTALAADLSRRRFRFQLFSPDAAGRTGNWNADHLESVPLRLSRWAGYFLGAVCRATRALRESGGAVDPRTQRFSSILRPHQRDLILHVGGDSRYYLSV